MAPTQDIAKFVRVYSTGVYQAFSSDACGYFCCYAADNMLRGLKPEHGLVQRNQNANEKVLMEYFPLTAKGAKKKGAVIGEGLFSSIAKRVKAVFNGKPRQTASARLQKFLDGEGSQTVTKMQIARKPVAGVIQKGLNALSLGQFEKMRRKLGYDEIMHNYMLVTLSNGKTYRVERNHQIEAKEATAADFSSASSRSDVPLGGKAHSLREMVQQASGNNPEWWRYSAASDGDRKTNNCQGFTHDMLERNGLQPKDPPRDRIQDADKLVSTLPFGAKPLNKLTDIAQVLDEMVHGGTVRWY